jgi:hypothetical protein
MLDSDLADLYRVSTGYLNLAVKRNLTRFPADFMFQLTKEESSLLLQFAIAKKCRGGRRTTPYVFTELGVAMLSSVLNSERAVQIGLLEEEMTGSHLLQLVVSIRIMRRYPTAFVPLREEIHDVGWTFLTRQPIIERLGICIGDAR